MYCRYWPGEDKPNYSSRVKKVNKKSIVFVGAGLSSEFGAPLMKEFFDKAISLNSLSYYQGESYDTVNRLIEVHPKLRSIFSITEDDVENIEIVLSLFETIYSFQIPELLNVIQNITPSDVSKFIEKTISFSLYLPSPSDSSWLSSSMPYGEQLRHLLRCIAYSGENVKIVTTNYDCIIEYFCHCLGLPFKYEESDTAAVEIIKLHGSSNWMRCVNNNCDSDLKIASMAYVKRREDVNGYIKNIDEKCKSCGSDLSPLIVPPTLSKDFNNKVLIKNWKKALQVLSEAETFVSLGYSLPNIDHKIKQLLSLGFSSSRLREAVIMIGKDDEAEKRWTNYFRESWRNTRLTVFKNNFRHSEMIIKNVLEVPYKYSTRTDNIVDSFNGILPVTFGPNSFEKHLNYFRRYLENKDTNILVTSTLWSQVLEQIRMGNYSNEYHELLKGTDLDWYPDEEILPIHGDKFKL